MELTKLTEQAQSLVNNLIQKGKEVDAYALELGDKENALTARKVELDNFQAELLQREKNVTPYENVGKALEAAEKAKAEAELELTKARGEREKSEADKKAFESEMEVARAQLGEQKALYERGAEENKKKQDQLDKKLKALQGVQD